MKIITLECRYGRKGTTHHVLCFFDEKVAEKYADEWLKKDYWNVIVINKTDVIEEINDNSNI